MTPSPAGVALEPRLLLPGVALGFGLVMAPVLASGTGDAAEAGAAGWAFLVAAVVVLVVLPLVAARVLLRRRTWVAADRVTVCAGGRVLREMRFRDLTEVRPGIHHGHGGDSRSSPRIVLRGTSVDGRATNVMVSAKLVRSVVPLVRALRPEVAARPDLVSSDLGRRLFEEYAEEPGPPPERWHL